MPDSTTCRLGMTLHVSILASRWFHPTKGNNVSRAENVGTVLNMAVEAFVSAHRTTPCGGMQFEDGEKNSVSCSPRDDRKPD